MCKNPLIKPITLLILFLNFLTMNIGINSTLGLMLRKLRRKRNLSQEAVAEISGLHINTIHLLEKGLNEPKLSTFFFLAKALEITPIQLMEMLVTEYYKG